jgi:hypothetical protein
MAFVCETSTRKSLHGVGSASRLSYVAHVGDRLACSEVAAGSWSAHGSL